MTNLAGTGYTFDAANSMPTKGITKQEDRSGNGMKEPLTLTIRR